MKLFKKKDKNIEADEALVKNAESAKSAVDGKNADGETVVTAGVYQLTEGEAIKVLM